MLSFRNGKLCVSLFFLPLFFFDGEDSTNKVTLHKSNYSGTCSMYQAGLKLTAALLPLHSADAGIIGMSSFVLF